MTGRSRFFISLAGIALLVWSGSTARASVAYGSINNFDTVNDTSNVCHGFEIELDDTRSTDITYTYDYNHYGTPQISEFTTNDSIGWHTNVIVRYEAVWTNSGWSAYTAIPTNNIPPTQGHAFTNPSLNFGGEHFGVGYRNSPTKVYYFWLTNDGSILLRGPQVYVSTPVFTAPAPAQIVPVIPAPVLPVPPPPLSDPTIVYEFSDATWVKVITTTSHTNEPIALRDLITPDTNNPVAKDWRHGEPSEVETEWQLLQTDFKSADYNPTNGVGGMNGQLPGATNVLNRSDDVVTYRYEYYAYVGPYADLDTHEALAQNVGADGIHGTGSYSNVVVVGKFLGAQMSAMSETPPIGLISHLPDAEINVLYPTRAVVVAPDTNFTATCAGLPNGMIFDSANGWIGNTPTESGVFIVTVTVSATNSPLLKKNYPLLVTDGTIPPPHCAVDTVASPLVGGTTTGDGVYTNDTEATVTAAAAAGYAFVSWTDNGVIVSTSASYSFTNILNRSLVANFVVNPNPPVRVESITAQQFVIRWPTNYTGFALQQNSSLNTTNWLDAAETVSAIGSNFEATIMTTNSARFFRLKHP
jgi:hypothetical protein